jgi:hypothetical protein
MEAEEGLLNVSAHRGLVYIMFERMGISNFGNRIPLVQAEISFDGQTAALETLDSATLDFGTNKQWIGDFTRKRIYFYADDAPTPAHLDEWNMETSLLEGQSTINEDLDSQNLKGFTILPPGDKAGMVLGAERTTSDPNIFLYNPRNGKLLDSSEFTGLSTDIQYVTWMQSVIRVAVQLTSTGKQGRTSSSYLKETLATFAIVYLGAASTSIRARLVSPMPADTAFITQFGFTDLQFDTSVLPGSIISHARIDTDQIVMLSTSSGGGGGRPSSLLFMRSSAINITEETETGAIGIPLPPISRIWNRSST